MGDYVLWHIKTFLERLGACDVHLLSCMQTTPQPHLELLDTRRPLQEVLRIE